MDHSNCFTKTLRQVLARTRWSGKTSYGVNFVLFMLGFRPINGFRPSNVLTLDRHWFRHIGLKYKYRLRHETVIIFSYTMPRHYKRKTTSRRRPRKKQTGGTLRRYYTPKMTKRGKQRGGILPFLIPLAIAGAKAAAMGGIGAGVSFGVKKGLERATH